MSEATNGQEEVCVKKLLLRQRRRQTPQVNKSGSWVKMVRMKPGVSQILGSRRIPMRLAA